MSDPVSADRTDPVGVRLLHVEDDPDLGFLVRRLLEHRPDLAVAEVHAVPTMAEALAALTEQGPYDVLLVDLHLPDGQGMGVLDRLLLHSGDAAVVVLTGDEGIATGIDVLRHGAAEFLPKSELTGTALTRAVRFGLERRRYIVQLRERAETDALTGLPNRRALANYYPRRAATAARTDGAVFLAVIDIDRFKRINDQFGHGAGDDALRGIGAALVDVVRTEDLVARIGGDEFVVCAGLERPELAEYLIDRLADVSDRVIDVAGQPVSVSIGTAVAHGGETLDEVLTRADAEMYRVKRQRQ